VPADHGVRLDDDERRSPARPGTREPRPEQAIRPREARSSGRAREHHELLAQDEVLQGDVAPRAYGAAQETAGEPKVGEQGAASFKTDAARLARTPSWVNQSDSDEILGPHTLDSFEFAAIPALNEQAVLELTKGHYLEANENIILVSPTGTGKTHISVALGIAACRQGKRVRFTTAAGLINELIEAQAQLRLSKLETTLLKLDLLILDEVGFVPFSKTGAELLFGVLTERYERGPVLVTTNLDFASWTEVFGDARLTGALLDRLTHRCHILEFQGDSYRFKESLHRKEKAKT
jgi:DNA replication protein DnaC